MATKKVTWKGLDPLVEEKYRQQLKEISDRMKKGEGSSISPWEGYLYDDKGFSAPTSAGVSASGAALDIPIPRIDYPNLDFYEEPFPDPTVSRKKAYKNMKDSKPTSTLNDFIFSPRDDIRVFAGISKTGNIEYIPGLMLRQRISGKLEDTYICIYDKNQYSVVKFVDLIQRFSVFVEEHGSIILYRHIFSDETNYNNKQPIKFLKHTGLKTSVAINRYLKQSLEYVDANNNLCHYGDISYTLKPEIVEIISNYDMFKNGELFTGLEVSFTKGVDEYKGKILEATIDQHSGHCKVMVNDGTIHIVKYKNLKKL